MLPFRSLARMQRLSNLLRKDMMNNLHKNKKAWKMLEKDHLPEIDENSHYEMKITTNNNGHVRVETAFKEPGKEWNVKVEEYLKDKNLSSVEQEKSDKKTEAIEQGKTEQVKKASPVEETVQGKTQEKTETVKESTEAPKKEEKGANVESAEKKDVPKEEMKEGKSNKQEKSKRKNHMSRRRDSGFDELQTIFNTLGRDFDHVNGDFIFLEPGFDGFDYEPRRRSNRNRNRRRHSSFNEMDAMLYGLQKDFGRFF